MKVDKKDLGDNNLELTIELDTAEIQPYLEKTAQKLSQTNKIPGFRAGKVPFTLLKKQWGEMKIYEAALENLLSYGLLQTIQKEKLITIGQPDIKVEKLAPDNPLIFTAVVALLPAVELGDWKKLNITQKTTEVKEEDIEKTLAQLQEMQVKEITTHEAAQKGYKVEMDFEVYIDKVIIEGGQNYKYPIVLGQGQMIPGFEDQIIGLKAGESKEFELKFPEKYYQANVAGKLATFKVKILNIYQRDLPALDHAFAKTIGFENLDQLKNQLRDNIKNDKSVREAQRTESEAIRAISQQAKIGAIPKKLLANEVHKMIHELEHSIRQQGLEMAGYLKSINKTHDDLHRDFEPQARERVQAALVLRAIARAENISSSSEEIETELDKQKTTYKNNSEALKNISHPDYKNHLANLITNQKVIKLIRENIIK